MELRSYGSFGKGGHWTKKRLLGDSNLNLDINEVTLDDGSASVHNDDFDYIVDLDLPLVEIDVEQNNSFIHFSIGCIYYQKQMDLLKIDEPEDNHTLFVDSHLKMKDFCILLEVLKVTGNLGIVHVNWESSN